MYISSFDKCIVVQELMNNLCLGLVCLDLILEGEGSIVPYLMSRCVAGGGNWGFYLGIRSCFQSE
jgi:hypothetical protein